MKHMWRIKMGFGNTTYTYKSLTGMVTDGHGEDAYAHYAIDLWPKDSNFTILSLARCPCALKKPPMRNSKKLFNEPPLNNYLEKLLWSKAK